KLPFIKAARRPTSCSRRRPRLRRVRALTPALGVMKPFALWLVVTLASLSSACDPALPLYLRNGCTEDITIQTLFTSGAIEQGDLEPGQRLAYMHIPPDVEIEKVSVFLSGSMIHSLSKTDIVSLMDSVSSPRQTTWNIERHEIRPLSAAQLKDLETSQGQ
ncbi:MAG: hypothetical protein ACREXY_05880, partial [Gammaproteobacteria bacterium]